jgi:hypothetical protein
MCRHLAGIYIDFHIQTWFVIKAAICWFLLIKEFVSGLYQTNQTNNRGILSNTLRARLVMNHPIHQTI